MKSTSLDKSVKYNLKTAVSCSEASIVSKIVAKNDAGNITLFAFDKGQNLSEHTAPFDAVVQIIEGSAIIQIDRKDYRLNAGEFIIMPANVPHAVEAVTSFKMLLIMLKA